jgi:thiamine-phosphate pyrophosphorylase
LSLQLPKIYPITDRVISGLSHTEQVRALIAGGAGLIQLREKQREAGEWLDDASEAIRIAKLAGVYVLINDRVDIAVAAGADGVHLGQNDMPPEAARRLLGDRAIIGYSTHTIDQVREALKLPVDYIAFGPIFSTSTKLDTSPIVGSDRLNTVRAELGELPLVAIGGINARNVVNVIEAGADSAAMIGAILSPSDDIAANLQQLILQVC